MHLTSRDLEILGKVYTESVLLGDDSPNGLRVKKLVVCGIGFKCIDKVIHQFSCNGNSGQLSTFYIHMVRKIFYF